jgi:tRNA threonylcarbamoyladenosine dehydratase
MSAPGGVLVSGEVAEALALSPEAFYAELIRRNRGVVSPDRQAALRDGTVLIAGCGSIGGAAAAPLARLGVQRFLVTDTGSFELNNLNRQEAGVRDLGRNKAKVTAERILAINPYAEVTVFPEGVNRDNVETLTSTCGAIVDGVDVTTESGLRAKFLLHRYAAAKRIPLVTGWDMAGVQYLQCYDYRRASRPFHGLVTEAEVDTLTPWELILRLVPVRRIPTEMLTDVHPNLQNPDYSVPQVVYAAAVFGAVSAHLVSRLLAGEPVREEIQFDVHRVVRPAPEQLANRLRWPYQAVQLRRALRRLRRTLGH